MDADFLAMPTKAVDEVCGHGEGRGRAELCGDLEEVNG